MDEQASGARPVYPQWLVILWYRADHLAGTSVNFLRKFVIVYVDFSVPVWHWFQFKAECIYSCFICHKSDLRSVPSVTGTGPCLFWDILVALLEFGLNMPFPPWNRHTWSVCPFQNGVKTWMTLCCGCEDSKNPTYSLHDAPLSPAEGCLDPHIAVNSLGSWARVSCSNLQVSF